MQSKATTVEQYLTELPEERKTAVEKLRKVINENLPQGFSEGIGYGMIGYYVPHTIYPKGYHCNPKLPLPFVSVASQKNFIALHHMGVYANPALLSWFTAEFPKHSKYKLDMGKGCIRFKNTESIPFVLIGELIRKVSVEDWISTYEKNFRK